MAAIPSTQVVYFFFEETASEFDFFEELYISRVARVCKVCLWSGGGLAAREPMGVGRGGCRATREKTTPVTPLVPLE